MAKYRISVSIDEQNYFWVAINNGLLIMNPTKDDLRGTKLISYSKTNICHRCRKENNIIDKNILYPGNACREKNKDNKETGEWVCIRHWGRDYGRHNPNSKDNIIKSLGDRRMGNLDPNSNLAKGDRGEELLCRWKGYTNLNKKNDNYKFPIDCLDENTGEYYQVRSAYYNPINRLWGQDFKTLQDSIRQGFRFKSLFLFCISKDGKVVKRVYEIPEKEIMNRTSINIHDNPTDSWGDPITPWYDQYKNKNEDIKKINEIWKDIIQ